jgi:hypothetical protein
MSTPKDISNEFASTDAVITTNDVTATNDDWNGDEVGYPAGMLWEGSMFPSTRRAERIWGPQDPLEVIRRKFDPFLFRPLQAVSL